MTLALLLSTDAERRLATIDELAPEVVGAAYAIRECLLVDDDADVRAGAAAWLGAARASCVGLAVADALYDTHPSVRMAACRALAKLRFVEALPTLRRLAVEEPIWWVRRAAVLAVARLARRDAIPLLRLVLDDPFWRVRHAAVRALVALGASSELSRPTITAAMTGSERAHGALRYIERKFGLVDRQSGGDSADTSADAGTSTSDAVATSSRLSDPDPAVVAARLEHGHAATRAELALYLGDPHEALRAVAAARLRSSGDARALLAAALWLEEPRIPHATAAVVALLDSLGPDVEVLLDTILSAPDARPGAATWAISYLAEGERWARLHAITSALRAQTPMVRRAATAALGAWLAARHGSDAERAELIASVRLALDDADEDVRRLAVHALVRSGQRDAWRVVCALRFDAQPRLVKRLITLAAHELADVATLELASRDGDPETRARGLCALHRLRLLGARELAEARASADPWLRAAVLDEASAADTLRHDPDPTARRIAFDCLAPRPEAARIAASDDDPWLRVKAAERLARSGEDRDLVRVLQLSRDPELAVRAAAADVLEAARDLGERLQRVRDTDDSVVRDAADTWLGTRARVLLDATSLPLAHALPLALALPPPLPVASPRPLGCTGLTLSPLVLSGAHEPSVGSLFRAMNAGCNGFFWEPRYRNLTTFLRAAASRGQRPVVIAGTYHATERAIRADVERTLRALGREHLDVFLVFWTRSVARLAGEVPRALARLRREGLIRAAGFSTHDRVLAEGVLGGRAEWDVMMVRHSAAHPGAEDRLFAKALARETAVFGFSATSYGRLLRSAPVDGETDIAPPSAADCYRYTLTQPGVTAVVSAPRGGRELVENLAVLAQPTLDARRMEELRAFGRRVREDSLDFARYIRRFPTAPDGMSEALTEERLDLHLSHDDDLGGP